jgi:hypothetical protein
LDSGLGADGEGRLAVTLAEGFRSLDDRIFRHERAPIVLALSVILFGTRLHGSMAT